MTQETTNREYERQASGLLTIQRVVAEHYKLPITAMKSKKRTAEYANARHVGMFLARSLLGVSFPDIAVAFGKKDHMSAVHGFRLVSDKIPQSAAFGDEVVALRKSARLQLDRK